MSANNRENIVEENMEVNVASEGQGASVNENHDTDHSITQQNSEDKNLKSEYHGLNLNAEKNMNKNIEGSIADCNLGSDDVTTPQINDEASENKRDSDELDNTIIHGNKTETSVVVKSEPSENSDCEMIRDMCIWKVAVENERNCNKIDENLSEKQNEIEANPEGTQNDTANNNKKPECHTENMNTVGNMVGSSKVSEEVGADRSPEMLMGKVSEVNISPKREETPSKVVINRESESLKSIMAYDGDSDSDSEHSDTELQVADSDVSSESEDEENNTNTKKTWRKIVDDDSGTSDSESDSSANTLSLESESDEENSDGDSGSVIDASDDGIRIDSSVLNKNCDKGAVKKKNPNILDLEEFLPPLPDLDKLNINVDEADFMHMGRVSAIISEFVTVRAIPGTPTFDLDSMLFVDDQTSKKPIGPIFDVLGPVVEPIYCVRFNTEKEVRDLGIKSGMKVYAVPKNDEFTKYVFVQELMKIKGSDASWRNDYEAPSDIAEFSDDEKEREARRAKRTSTKRKLDDGSLERHRRYERTMNQCNALNTRVCKLMDAHKNVSKHIRPVERDDIKLLSGCPDLPPIPPPQFDPTVPPPGFGQDSYISYPASQLQYFNTSSSFGQSPNFNDALSAYNNESGGSYSPFGSPLSFEPYATEPPSPQGLCPPSARWSWQGQREAFRRPPRSNNPRANQQNSDSYFTNNGRNFRGAGPSSQTF